MGVGQPNLPRRMLLLFGVRGLPGLSEKALAGDSGRSCLMSPRHLTFECGVGTVTTAYGDAPGSESLRFLLLLSVLLLSAASRSFRHLHLDQEGGLIISEHTRHVYE